MKGGERGLRCKDAPEDDSDESTEALRAAASWSSPRRRSEVNPSESTKIEALILRRWLPKNA